MRIAALKREEDSLSKERERLEAEKMRHIRSAAKRFFVLRACLATL